MNALPSQSTEFIHYRVNHELSKTRGSFKSHNYLYNDTQVFNKIHS